MTLECSQGNDMVAPVAREREGLFNRSKFLAFSRTPFILIASVLRFSSVRTILGAISPYGRERNRNWSSFSFTRTTCGGQDALGTGNLIRYTRVFWAHHNGSIMSRQRMK